ncbi:MAG: hypothetical protein WDO19_30180 [Bacteroidota bacterium]
MTLHEFKSLDFNDQAAAIWSNGVLLEHKDEGQTRFILYSIDDFFAEIHYNQERNEITCINSLESDEELQPYLDKINLVELLNKSI